MENAKKRAKQQITKNQPITKTNIPHPMENQSRRHGKSNYSSLAYNFYKLLFVEDPDYYQQVTCQAEDRCYDYSACREDVGIEGLL